MGLSSYWLYRHRSNSSSPSTLNFQLSTAFLAYTRLRGVATSSAPNPLAANPSECPCWAGHVCYQDFDERALGDDSDFGEVSICRCKRCGQNWLHYLMEYEHLTAAGRWFRGAITPEMAASATPEGAKEMLESLPWYFCGGSNFAGKISRIPSGQLRYFLG